MDANKLKLRNGWRVLLAVVVATGAVGAPGDGGPVTPTVVTIQERELPVYPGTLPAGLTLPSPGATKEGHEYLVVRTAAGARAVVLVTVEAGPLNLRYGAERIGKGEQLKVDADDFPTLAATGLHSAAELERTTAITGKPVAEITRIGRPGMASGSGFLAEDEDILSVLQGDNALVGRLGLKHRDLARPLFHVWNLLLREYELGKLGRFKDDVGGFWYHGREIQLRSQRTKGFQESIFNDEIKGAFDIELWRELDVGEREFLDVAYAHLGTAEREALDGRLTRLRTGEMEPYYIMRYGFYEGHTEYRVDPIALALTFGLRPLAEIEKAFPGELHRVLTSHFTARARREGGIEEKAQPGAPAKRSEPFSPDSRRPSSAAGVRRRRKRWLAHSAWPPMAGTCGSGRLCCEGVEPATANYSDDEYESVPGCSGCGEPAFGLWRRLPRHRERGGRHQTALFRER